MSGYTIAKSHNKVLTVAKALQRNKAKNLLAGWGWKVPKSSGDSRRIYPISNFLQKRRIPLTHLTFIQKPEQVNVVVPYTGLRNTKREQNLAYPGQYLLNDEKIWKIELIETCHLHPFTEFVFKLDFSRTHSESAIMTTKSQLRTRDYRISR